jgi:hypothetical protein
VKPYAICPACGEHVEVEEETGAIQLRCSHGHSFETINDYLVYPWLDAEVQA